MARITYLDELINYKAKIINTLGSSQEVMGLIADDPNIDLNSEEADRILTDNIKDFNYLSDTTQKASAFILVDVEIPKISSGTIKDMVAYVQVVVNKDYMKLGDAFKGVKGNRKDNLVRQVDLLLNGQRGYGISRLDLEQVTVVSVPDTYTSTLLTYEVVDFNRNARRGNE